MKVYSLHREQWVPAPRDEIFAFFSDARNLALLTPRRMRFEILNREPVDLRAGAVIRYRLRPFGVPIRWTSEIARWEPPHLFSDIQRSGPYRLWDHTHRFQEEDGGTRMLDDVRYALHFGWLVHPFVSRELDRVFAYRRERVEAMFGRK